MAKLLDAAPYAKVLNALIEDGATERALAQAMGYSAAAIHLIRTGKTKRIFPQTARAIEAMIRLRPPSGG